MKISKFIFFIFTVLLLNISCTDEKEILVSPIHHVDWQIKKVAVILPLDNGLDEHWQRTLMLARKNLCEAFKNQEKGVVLEYEWYDETTADIDSLSKALAVREDIIAVIGGLYSSNATIMASEFSKNEKTFFTLATTEELIRSHAKKGYLWAMTETDITQCEVLLSKAIYYGAESVSLLVNKEDSYGKTFLDWFAFQAQELNLEVKGVYGYNSDDLAMVSKEAAASGADYVICVPSEIEDIRPMLDAFTKQAEEEGMAPRTLFSDTAYGSDVIDKVGSACEGLEGVTFGASPESGFEVSYETFFKEPTTLGEAQVYDAAMLLTYACWLQLCEGDVSLKDALREVVDGRDINTGSWMTEDIEIVIDALANGKRPDINGASGRLDFDSKVYTNVLHTTYYNYKIYENQYIIIDYNSSDGGNRTDATLASWNWKIEHMQELDENMSDLKYPPLKNKWALLIAGSTEWKNYRHQADVLAVYQSLKSQGYDDDHIILIMEDDIAQNKYNPNPGVIQVNIGGPNLYHDIHIDYKLTSLDPTDIRAILMGEKSDRLPHVIHADDSDNILVFWSGHGEKENLCWENRFWGFTAQEANNMFKQMSEKRCYRKMLWLVETCYAGSVLNQVEGYPGILAITASNEQETSKADVYNDVLGAWMTNRFTYTLRDELAKNKDISIQRLYYKLFINTIGSHVMIYNQENYGNVFTNKLDEFL